MLVSQLSFAIVRKNITAHGPVDFFFEKTIQRLKFFLFSLMMDKIHRYMLLIIFD